MSKPKRYAIWIIILLIIGAGVYYFVQSRKPKIEYTTETARRDNLAQTVSVTGEIVPENQAELGFQISGEVSRVYVDVGDKIVKGQRLAQLKAGTQIAELAQSEKALEAQKQTYKDYKEKDDTYSDEQRRSQRATVEQYEAAVQEARVNLARTILYSPLDGVITQRSIDIGEIVAVTDTVFTIIGKGGLEIRADVPESDIVKVKVGQKAEITFDALTSEDIFEAEVTEIEPASTVIQDVVYYKVKLKLTSSDERLKPGMSADIDIKAVERNNVIIIPLRAVKTEAEQDYVEILKGENVVEKIKVETGLEGDEGMVEVISGLSGGEKVIIFTKTE